jgi:hypothetical protein
MLRTIPRRLHGKRLIPGRVVHASTTDPDAQIYRKGPGKEAKLCFRGHALMERPVCVRAPAKQHPTHFPIYLPQLLPNFLP